MMGAELLAIACAAATPQSETLAAPLVQTAATICAPKLDAVGTGETPEADAISQPAMFTVEGRKPAIINSADRNPIT